MNLVRLTSTPLHSLLRTLPSFTTSLHVRQLASMAPPTPAPASAPRRPDALHAGEAITVPSLSASYAPLPGPHDPELMSERQDDDTRSE